MSKGGYNVCPSCIYPMDCPCPPPPPPPKKKIGNPDYILTMHSFQS